MVPWSEIITGAVGVAGIGGALLNGRWQAAAVNRSIAAQDERAKVAEGRRIYAAAYTALCDGLLAMPGAESSDNDSDTAALKSARARASNAASELQLMASASVGRCARDALNALQDGDGEALLEALAELMRAMRTDLGVEPLDAGDLW